MDTTWIQVFVLTLSECVAPAGKTVCQEREVEIQFLDKAACEAAMEQMIWLADGASDVIVNHDKTRCAASAVQRPVFTSAEEVKAQVGSSQIWQDPDRDQPTRDVTQKAHMERLASLPTCEDAGGEAPCKIGEIIIEGASEQRSDIWRLNR